MIFSKCCNYIYRWLFADSVVSGDTCYIFEFDTINPADEIWGFTYNNGTQNIGLLNVPFDATEIGSAIGDAGITYEEITVSRAALGGGLFRYTITFKNTDFTIDVLDISGNGTSSTTTNCT